MSVHCCPRMTSALEHDCELHEWPAECPDSLIAHSTGGEYGLRVHDGGASYIVIAYCPWCGTALPGAAPVVHRADDHWKWDGDWDHHPGPITLTCCGRKPFEVGTGDHMTWDDDRVTCTGGAS